MAKYNIVICDLCGEQIRNASHDLEVLLEGNQLLDAEVLASFIDLHASCKNSLISSIKEAVAKVVSEKTSNLGMIAIDASKITKQAP